jgi:heme-degrading monooxygenase HmoA
MTTHRLTAFATTTAAAAAAATLLPATAPAAPAAQTAWPVVAIVRVAKPALAPRAFIAAKMREAQPEYARLDGLAFKAFSFERETSDFGGVYLWRDEATARAWFNDAWFARFKRERGVEGQVRFFVAPVTLDNQPGGTPADERSASVVTLVEIAVPPGLGADRLLAGFKAAVPQYQAIPGLLRKSFTWQAGPDGTPVAFGGVYLWRDEASARAWFTEAWHARVQQTYGRAARIEWFDTPILLPNAAATAALSQAGALVVAAP